MSRKFDRKYQINRKVRKVREVLEDPQTLTHLAFQIIRPRPRFVPRFVWCLVLLAVLTPSMRKPMPTPEDG